MRKRKPWFQEGDWFTVPLRRNAHAIGLVARADRRGDSFLGYYFPSAASERHGGEPIDLLTPRDAVLVAASGCFGFRSNTWKVFASSSPLDYAKWPIPKFVRIDPSGHKHYETYGDHDVLLPIPAEDDTISPLIPTAAIEDTLLDAGAVEDALWYRLRNRILGG